MITPKEGSKLVLRNALGVGQEDFFVDAVEVVSFNEAIFFRSLEAPKFFLLPASSYEVLEVKETGIVLKNAVAQEKSIKIGSGMKEDNRSAKDKRNKKRRKPSSEPQIKNETQGGDAKDETTEVSSSVLKKLFPPPDTLIKEKLTRFKNEEFFEENILPSLNEEKKLPESVEDRLSEKEVQKVEEKETAAVEKQENSEKSAVKEKEDKE